MNNFNYRGTDSGKEKEVEYRVPLNYKIPKKSKTLPFDLNEFSIISKGSDCLPACGIMAALYWEKRMPELEIESDIVYWKKLQEDTSFRNIKGTSLAGIHANLKLKSKLVFRPKNPESINDLIPAFYVDPPIVQIIIYDDLFVQRETTSNGHAAIISQINMLEKKIILIDPSNFNVNTEKIVLKIYDLTNFIKGWKLYRNLVIWVYPNEMKKKFEVKEGQAKITKSTQIDLFSFINNQKLIKNNKKD